MANPNIDASTSTLLVSKGVKISSGSTVTLIPAVTTSHVYQVDLFELQNTSANTVTPIIGWLDSSSTVTTLLTGSIALQTGSGLVVNVPPLNEGDVITATCDYVNGLDAIIGYKDIS